MKRFWDKVNKHSGVYGIDGQYPTECWEWQACRLKNGYGHFKVQSRLILAHRFSWILFYGIIPEHLCVLHKCDNPACVNIQHLFLGTHADNMFDRDKKGRCRARGPLGEKHGNAKLMPNDIVKIRQLYQTGQYTQQEISIMFQISRGHVHQIIYQKRWKHI